MGWVVLTRLNQTIPAIWISGCLFHPFSLGLDNEVRGVKEENSGIAPIQAPESHEGAA